MRLRSELNRRGIDGARERELSPAQWAEICQAAGVPAPPAEALAKAARDREPS